MRKELDKNLCQVIDVIKDKIKNIERQINLEIAGIESAIKNKSYSIAHSKIDKIDQLNDDIRDLHNYLINTNNCVSSIKTFKDFAWTEPEKNKTDSTKYLPYHEFANWNGLLKVYDVNKSKEVTISIVAGYGAYSEPRKVLNSYNDYLSYEICIWDDEDEIITDYFDNDDSVCGYKDVKFINNLLTKIQLK